MARNRWLISSMLALGLTVAGCWGSGDEGKGADPDAGADADTDADSDSDADSDADTDSDADPDEGCVEEAETIVCDQGVYDGNATITYDSDLEDLAGYTEITGHLQIGCETCVSLCQLICLETVGGMLFVGQNVSSGSSDNLALEDLDGLNNLTSVGASFSLSDNPVLERIDELGSLTAVGSGVGIYGNQQLASLEGLEGIESINSYLQVHSNGSLLDMIGLDGLVEVDGDVSLYANHAMLDLQGLESLTTVTGRLEIGFPDGGEDLWPIPNESLESLAGLEGLTSVLELSVGPNPQLPYCEVCGLLDQVGLTPAEIVCEGNLDDGCWTGAELDCP